MVRGLEERARHLALATETRDERVATVVEAAATAASSRGSPAAAAELIAHARRLTPPGGGRSARRRALAAVDYEFAAGDTARASALLDEALADEPPGRYRALLRSRRARLRHFTDDIGASADELYAALADAGDDARFGPRSRRASRGGCCSCAATSAPRRSTRAPRRAGPSAPATAPRSPRRWPPTP